MLDRANAFFVGSLSDSSSGTGVSGRGSSKTDGIKPKRDQKSHWAAVKRDAWLVQHVKEQDKMKRTLSCYDLLGRYQRQLLQRQTVFLMKKIVTS